MPREEKWIKEIVGVFCDPIIVMPGGWGESLPPWIKEAITMERLLENIHVLKDGGLILATDAEAVAYIFTACLTNPIDKDWTDIYTYLVAKVMKQHSPHGPDFQFPKDVAPKELTDYQKQELVRFKRWLYEARVKHRKGYDHDKEPKKATREANPEEPAGTELVQLGFQF